MGRNITLNSIAYQIVGVMPPGFHFPSRISVWIPVTIGTAATVAREAHTYLAIARLHNGAKPTLAVQELAGIATELERTYPDSNPAIVSTFSRCRSTSPDPSAKLYSCSPSSAVFYC